MVAPRGVGIVPSLKFCRFKRASPGVAYSRITSQTPVDTLLPHRTHPTTFLARMPSCNWSCPHRGHCATAQRRLPVNSEEPVPIISLPAVTHQSLGYLSTRPAISCGVGADWV